MLLWPNCQLLNHGVSVQASTFLFQNVKSWPNPLSMVSISGCNGSNIFLALVIKAMSPSVQFSLSVMSESLWPHKSQHTSASLSITNSQSLLKLMSIELVMPSSHLILCRPLLLLPPIPPSIRVFSSESTLCMRWPKYWSFSFSISPSWTLRADLLQDGLVGSPWSPRDSQERVFSNTTVQKHQFFGAQLSS